MCSNLNFNNLLTYLLSALTAARCLNRLKLHRQPQQPTALCKAVPLLNTCRHYFPNITELILIPQKGISSIILHEIKPRIRFDLPNAFDQQHMTIGGGARPSLPPGGPNSFNFMQFLGKYGKIVCWRPPGSWRPLLGEILDPPLTIVINSHVTEILMRQSVSQKHLIFSLKKFNLIILCHILPTF